MKLKVFFLSTLLSSCLFASYAQEDSTKIHQKMDLLFTTMNLEAIHMAGVTASLQQVLHSNAQLANYTAKMTTYYNKYLASAAISGNIQQDIQLMQQQQLQANVDELNQLIKVKKPNNE
jgi:hypothetical protein